MNVGNQVRKLLLCNLTSLIGNVPLRRSMLTSVHGVGKCKDMCKYVAPYLNIHDNSGISMFKEKNYITFDLITELSAGVSSNLSIKDSLARLKISEPNIVLDVNVGLPVNSLNIKDFELPSSIKSELVDPVDSIIEKKALNMIRIRKKKMKKHKWKKLQKKMKFVFAKIRRKRKAIREAELLKEVTASLKAGENYDPSVDVKEKLELLNWKRPVTVMKGMLCPKYVIEQELEKRRLRNLLKDRVEECLKKIGPSVN